jgi:hypothetical protein
LTLYAFTDKIGHSEIQDISARIADLDGPTGVDLVEGELLSALIGPTSRYRPLRSLEYNRYARLQHQQVVLEAAMEETRVLPATFGTTMPTLKHVRGLLDSHGKRLQTLMERYGDLVELEIVVSWNVSEVVRSILATDGLEIPDGSQTNRNMARALEAAIEDKRRSLKSNIEEAINVVCKDSRALAFGDETTLLRQVVLLTKDREDRLFSLLRQINQCGGGKIAIKCIGPLPPCRFASVRVHPSRIDNGQIANPNLLNGEIAGTDIPKNTTAEAVRGRPARRMRQSPLDLLTRIANGKSLTQNTTDRASRGQGKQDGQAQFDPTALDNDYLISIDSKGSALLRGTSPIR